MTRLQILPTFPRPEPEAQIRADMAELAAARRAVAAIAERLHDRCREWSDANGYKVILTGEQVMRAVRVKAERERV